MAESSTVISGTNNTEGGGVFQGNHIAVNGGSFAVYFGQSDTKDDEASQCVAALYLTDAIDDRDRIVNTRGPRTEHTCEWILNTDEYRAWLETSSHLLWLCAGPGKGKTMLAIYLANHIAETVCNGKEHSTILQFYCDNRDNKRNSPVAVLRGLISQMVQTHTVLLRHILPTYRIQKDRLFQDSGFESLWRIFSIMVKDPELGNLYCILDGLDECIEQPLEIFLKQIKNLFADHSEERPNKMKVLVTSRETPESIPRILAGVPRIKMEDPKFKSIEELLNKLLQRADGTFLWVSFVISDLQRRRTTREIVPALDDLPIGLDGIYTRILLQIPRRRWSTAAVLLKWTALAIRPLTLTEIGAIIQVKAGPGQSVNAAVKEEIGICQNMLVVHKNSVHLVHASVKDFLQKKNKNLSHGLEEFIIESGAAHLEIATFCVKYLQSGPLDSGTVTLKETYEFEDAILYDPTSIGHSVDGDSESDGSTVDEELSSSDPLLTYCSRYWFMHIRHAAKSNPTMNYDEVVSFCGKSTVRNVWFDSLFDDMDDIKEFTQFILEMSLDSVRSLEDSLATYGSWSSSSDDSDWDSDGSLDSNLGNAFSWVTHQIVRKVRKTTGTKPNVGKRITHFGRYATTPVKLKKPVTWSPMIVATFFGLHPIVRELQSSLWTRGSLLENIDEPTEEGITALMISSIRGDGQTTQALLDCGANVSSTTKTGNSCLHLACLVSNSVIGLLLQRGAAVDARNQYGYTPLHEAASSTLGGEVTLKLLLSYGADLYATTANGANALHLASGRGNLPFLEAFLEEMLKRITSENDSVLSGVLIASIINAQDARGWTPLHEACGLGETADYDVQEQIVQKLFECGADPYLRNDTKQTALEIAVVKKHPSRVIETLQEEILARQLSQPITSRPSRLG